MAVDSFYTPLDTTENVIRLIRAISPGVFELTTHVLDEAPAYSALSYCWSQGEGKHGGFIKFAGSEGASHYIWVSHNLYAFFQRNPSLDPSKSVRPTESLWDVMMRSPQSEKYKVKSTEYFWIDAICIDQSDDEEKGLQVQIIGHIYSQAQQVIAWLGEPDQDVLALSKPTYFKQLFTHNKYWSRMWIAQEFILARHMIFQNGALTMTYQEILDQFCPRCHSSRARYHCCDFRDSERFQNHPLYGLWRLRKDLSKLAYTLPRQKDLNGTSLTAWNGKTKLREINGLANSTLRDQIDPLGLSDNPIDNMERRHLSLEEAILILTTGRECSDARDKIYSLLSICSESGFKVDYSIHREELLCRVLIWPTNENCFALIQALRQALQVSWENVWTTMLLHFRQPQLRPRRRCEIWEQSPDLDSAMCIAQDLHTRVTIRPGTLRI